MPRHLINFANEEFTGHQQLAGDLAAHFGIRRVFSYGPEDIRRIDSEFFRRNEAVLTHPRGAGYWLWKPFLILHTLQQIRHGEVLMYCDSGAFLVQDPSELFALADLHEQIFFNMPAHPNRQWTKQDIFQALDADSEEFWDEPQVKAQCHLWKHCMSSLARLREWLYYCQLPGLITDEPSHAPNLPGFIENRHDQAILSVLVAKWGCEIFRDPSQEGTQYADRFPNSPYPLLLSALGKGKV